MPSACDLSSEKVARNSPDDLKTLSGIFYYPTLLDMKSALALALGLVGSTIAEPVLWPRSSPRNLFSRAEANSILASRSISSSPASFVTTNYDYLVVGGGTAGLALATRLSESGKYMVGVLEAGTSGLGVPIIDIPGDFGLDLGTIYDCACFYLGRK